MSVPEIRLNPTPSETQNPQQNLSSGKMQRGQEIQVVNRAQNDPVAIMSFLVDKSLHMMRLRVQFQPNPSGELPRKESIWIMRKEVPQTLQDWAAQRSSLETSRTPLQLMPRRLTSVTLLDGKLIVTSSDGRFTICNFGFGLSTQLEKLPSLENDQPMDQEKLSLGFGDGAITTTTLQSIGNTH